ncbi:MAG: type II toxin-antitoxin system HicB family antitoxin [Patescibacteria group bacterium]|nr:type II toxin-antitoxin system HicB family antitoxin [Patescibacteria group bacterium]
MIHKREFTAVYQKKNKYYIAWIEEIPGVNTQGRTKKEVKENLKEALKLILSANRDISKKQRDIESKRELIQVAVPA